MNGNENLPDPDYDDNVWDDEHDEPDYWACYGCMQTWGIKQFGNMCPNCGSYLEEEHY